MRSRVAHVAVFVCVFCLFLGYCEWWKLRPEVMEEVRAHSPPDASAFVVEGAADETFNGIYIPIELHDCTPCFMKEVPRRFLWRSKDGWHLSTEPMKIADGYRIGPDVPITAEWSADGADEPAPIVAPICEGVAHATIAAAPLPGDARD